MLPDVTVDQILHAGRGSDLVTFGEWVAAKIDIAPQFPRAVARCCYRPFRPACECHAPLPPGKAVVEGEGAPTAAKYLQTSSFVTAGVRSVGS